MRKKGFYRQFDILIERGDGWYFYSVLDPTGEEVIGGHREDGCDITEFYSFLEKQVDEYLTHPTQYREDDHDVKMEA